MKSTAQKIAPSHLSVTSHRIEPGFSGEKLSSATGFFYEFEGRPWLVTNWHVVSGINAVTHKILSKLGALPNELNITVARYCEIDGQRALSWFEVTIPLHDESGSPKWKIHPKHGESVDLAVLEFAKLTEGVLAVNDSKLDGSQHAHRVGMDAFVLGYPLGLVGGASFPIWKRASIASEPDIDLDQVPKLYIDTATREGMSGSPVFTRASGLWAPEGVIDLKGHFIGEGERFIGVYSGRMLGEDQFAAQLGIVWKESAIIETIQGERYDTVR